MLVLKIIGICLLSVLALILLILLLVLMVPIRYDANASADGKNIAEAVVHLRAHWLLHLVSIEAALENGHFGLQGRIFFIRLFGEKKEKEDRKKDKKNRKKTGEKKENKKTALCYDAWEEDDFGEENENTETSEQEKKSDTLRNGQTESSDSQDTGQTVRKDAGDAEHKTQHNAKQDAGDDAGHRKNSKNSHLKKPPKEKKKKKPENPNSLSKRLKRLYEQRDRVQRVYEKEKGNLEKAKKRTFGMLKKLLPRKCDGFVEFGMSDPSLTGKILGYVSALYAFTGPVLSLYPDFTEEKLKGRIKIKGHFTLLGIGIYILEVPFNKELRHAFRYLKKLSEAETDDKNTGESDTKHGSPENNDTKK